MTPKDRTVTKAILKVASLNLHTGNILFTWELTMPRNILAELNTHRATSKNTSSSRAISLKKLRQKVWSDAYLPIHIGREQRGMQAGGELTGWRRAVADAANQWFRLPALLHHWILMKVGVHKQVANRYLEPWMWCKVVLSATDIRNLLTLRTDKDAEPNFRDLALQMAEQAAWVWGESHEREFGSNVALGVECFQGLKHGEWHTPYVSETESFDLSTEQAKMLSIARCANTSYTLPGDEIGVSDIQKAQKIAEKLFGGSIKHLSPTEHVATPMYMPDYNGNFCGWTQFRKTIPGEHGGDR